jgi:Protein of unknown function (DUF2568)
VRAANLALKFLLELAAIAALAYWGPTAADGVLAVVLAVAAPALFVVNAVLLTVFDQWEA